MRRTDVQGRGLEKKVAIVTGGGSRMGQEGVTRFVADGRSVPNSDLSKCSIAPTSEAQAGTFYHQVTRVFTRCPW